jgi:hypothetical protein
MTYDDMVQLLDAETEVLLRHVGDATMFRTLQARQITDAEREAAGRSWIQEHLHDLRRLICSSLLYQTYATSKRTQDRVMLVAAIADLIASITSGLAAVSVAVLIMRESLVSFCGGDEKR